MRILLTGGTGSFGQAFTDFLLAEHSAELERLVIYSRDELKQFYIAERLGDERIRFFIGDVRDLSRLNVAMKDMDVVVHAAALKQIPALEYNPTEAIHTNIIGTMNVISACLAAKVPRAVMMSTDKAVHPVNLYGATKLCAEKLFLSSNAYEPTHCRFSATRYGNVFNSRGSVIPFFRKMARKGSIPITHQEMTRFFIHLREGCQFVWNAIQDMHGGEIFIPKLPSMRIIDLAKAIGGDCCDYPIIGIRPGEKLYESMIADDPSSLITEEKDRFILETDQPWREHVTNGARRLHFEYRSDTNPHFLSVQDIKNELANDDPIRET